jgi:hypothetical protein
MIHRISKFGAIPTIYNGRRYASKKEATRAFELDLLKKGNVIKDWIPQPRFPFVHNGVKICEYVGDFKVIEKDGSWKIEDVKSSATKKIATYVIKKKLMLAFYNIKIVEI